ncbi:hypothetical protein B0H16DRAFT_991428 [Mycena metata]|uniref:Uncharacterized protein n=1 Tax=Mycena metata TaxID=1033252 RepID=A0AAD7IM23_9AGAR|nr:hypothetical protein B0H16DRAFT_991428 [Mycena metata]
MNVLLILWAIYISSFSFAEVLRPRRDSICGEVCYISAVFGDPCSGRCGTCAPIYGDRHYASGATVHEAHCTECNPSTAKCPSEKPYCQLEGHRKYHTCVQCRNNGDCASDFCFRTECAKPCKANADCQKRTPASPICDAAQVAPRVLL